MSMAGRGVTVRQLIGLLGHASLLLMQPVLLMRAGQESHLALSFGAVRDTSISGLRPSPRTSPSSTLSDTGRARAQQQECLSRPQASRIRCTRSV